jgi:pimeloyl-ACP methyl ester carboxylesterase
MKTDKPQSQIRPTGEDYQGESAQIEINGEQLSYLRRGSGHAVLLLHGLLGGSFGWRFNVSALSQTHTVLSMDLPGFGHNDAPRHADCGMEAQALRLSGMLKKLRLPSVDVIGSSWGGAVAMLLAAQSSMVRSMVLAAPVNPWSSLGAGRIRFLNGRLGSTLLRLALPVSRPVHLTALQRMYGDARRIPPGTIQGYSSRLLRRGRVDNILSTLRAWEKDIAALRTAIPQIKARTLLIWGTQDGAVDLRSATPLMQALPQCELALMEGAGHLPFEEMPGEFNRLALAFLDRG